MPSNSRRLAALPLLLLPLALPLEAQEARPARTFGLAAAVAVGGAPLGEIAERNGTFAVPGREVEVRALARSGGGTEWSLGVLSDEYRLDQEPDRFTRSRFDYSSTALVLGYAVVERGRSGVPIVYGLDLGWRRFDANSAVPSYYTGEAEATRVRGDAVLFGASYGVEIPLETVRVVPRVRIETNYPDFGGGDGYSALHRQHDLGFRASFGVGVKIGAGSGS